MKDIVTGFSKGYAFVEYETVEDAQRAVEEAYKISIDGKEIFVDYEMERVLPGWIPRRLGTYVLNSIGLYEAVKL